MIWVQSIHFPHTKLPSPRRPFVSLREPYTFAPVGIEA